MFSMMTWCAERMFHVIDICLNVNLRKNAYMFYPSLLKVKSHFKFIWMDFT